MSTKEKTKYGYKVVSEVNGSKTSYTMIGLHKYHINRWTVPMYNFGPLCVFSSKEAARVFLKRDYVGRTYHVAIYMCEYVPSDGVKIWTPRSYSKLLAELPKGTHLAKKVKLIEKIPFKRERKQRE
jgi:hypothetical protein